MSASTSTTRAYGRGAAVLTLGIGATGLITFAYFSLSSYALTDEQYGRISLLWSTIFITVSVLYRPVEQLLSRTIADREFDLATAIEVLEHVPAPEATVAEMARVARRWLIVSVPREPLWRGLNVVRGAYLRDLGNTPGHVNHWSKRAFVSLLSRYGTVEEARSPLPWTMALVRLH